MVHAIVGGNRTKVEGIDAVQATDVVAVLVRVRSTLMVGMDAAVGTEVVLRGPRVELVQLERGFALEDLDSRERNGCDHGALSPADRAIAAPRINDSLRQIEFEND